MPIGVVAVASLTRSYQDHPEHRVVAQNLVKPIARELIRVQYLVRG